MTEPSALVEGLRSIRLGQLDRIPPLESLPGIAIVGSTCSGKSTIVDAIRESELTKSAQIDVPKRCITRPQRKNDNLVENMFLTPEELTAAQDEGKLAFSWVRHMENGRTEQYGFFKPQDGALPVYSGNNALYEHPEDITPSGALEPMLFVGIYAPDEVREERLKERSPDLFRDKPDEVKYRLGDSSKNMLGHVGIVIDKHGHTSRQSEKDVLVFLERLIAARRG